MDEHTYRDSDIWACEEAGKCGSRRGMTAEQPGNDPRKIHFKQNHSVHIALLSVCGGILPQMLNCFQNIIYYKPDKIIHMTNFEN